MMLAAAALALPLNAAQPAKKTAKVKKQNKKEVKASKKWDHEQVVELITKVNNYWQANNKPEVRAFWDNAAYHTGNMEVYKMLKDQKMLDYTIRWAEHNDWTGATEQTQPSGSTNHTARVRITFSSATGKSASRLTSTSTTSRQPREMPLHQNTW